VAIFPLAIPLLGVQFGLNGLTGFYHSLITR
jgi:hypothetical protein